LIHFGTSKRFWPANLDRATLTFLNLRVSEVQETSDWRTHDWNVVSEQRKSNWQHPNTHYREREETPGDDECDTSYDPHPHRTVPTKAVQIMADPSRDVILEAIHFLVEIRNPRHARLSCMLSIRSYNATPVGVPKFEGVTTERPQRGTHSRCGA
jgi:hypothetical protein